VVRRFARPVAMVAAALGGLVLIGAGFTPHVNPDADAYWHAALRLREGLPLYGGPRGDETEIYRYAPWFAFAWVPLTYLGQANAYLVWRALLLAAAVAAVWPLLRLRSPAAVTLAVLALCLMVSNLPAANVTTLIVGVLAVGLPTLAGPVLLGFAGSLKVFPLLFVAGYLAQRRWRDTAVALGIAAILWLHVLVFDVSTYPTAVGGSSFYVGGTSLYAISPVLWGIATGLVAALVVLLVVTRSPWTWLAAGAAISTVVPRAWLPDAAYIVPAAIMLLRSAKGLGASRVPGYPVRPRRQPAVVPVLEKHDAAALRIH
jgi:hypothetical protein